jgi:hypothetical protein
MASHGRKENVFIHIQTIDRQFEGAINLPRLGNGTKKTTILLSHRETLEF